MAAGERPLSPHLQIYRWTVTMAVSITHRLTGLALGAGALLLTWWLVAAATGPDAFAAVQGFLAHWTGRLVLFGFAWSLFFHLLNGVRHLFWDIGLGFAVGTARATAWIVILLSFALTVLAFAGGYGLLGGAP